MLRVALEILYMGGSKAACWLPKTLLGRVGPHTPEGFVEAGGRLDPQNKTISGPTLKNNLSGPLERGTENPRILDLERFHLDTQRVPKLVPHPASNPGLKSSTPPKEKQRFPRARRAGIRSSGAGFCGFPGQGRR
jgi:hypothetical protein